MFPQSELVPKLKRFIDDEYRRVDEYSVNKRRREKEPNEEEGKDDM
jgi:hypothetical protein